MAAAAPKQSAAPTVKHESIATRLLVSDIFEFVSFDSGTFDIASPPALRARFNWILQKRPQRQIGPITGGITPFVAAADLGFERDPLNLPSTHAVIGIFLGNIRIHRLGIGNI